MELAYSILYAIFVLMDALLFLLGTLVAALGLLHRCQIWRVTAAARRIRRSLRLQP